MGGGGGGVVQSNTKQKTCRGVGTATFWNSTIIVSTLSMDATMTCDLYNLFNNGTVVKFCK